MTKSSTIRGKLLQGCGTQIMSPSSLALGRAENKDAHDEVQSLTLLGLGATNHPTSRRNL